ncbi:MULTISPECIES: CU044_5270 family protein [Streptomyces]|uniref:CU044_5270 family protein n=1 Tax=Streptomyces TaxID=1883 RepID=UPI000F87A677|nr:CU044_5270 family protein [Streptomyces sp. WAC 01325]WCH97490.1 CU044_5270 family protein [Streptomyces moderatus]
MREIDEGLRFLDPARSNVAEPDEETLAEILAAPRQERKSSITFPRVRWWALTTGGLVATAVALTLVVTNMLGVAPQPAYAVTPAPLKYRVADRPAPEVLEQIAQRAEKLPDDSSNDGKERFVQDSWSLSTRVDGIQVTSAVIPERRVTWRNPDGSEKWKVRTLKPQFRTKEQSKVWEESGSVGRTPQEYSGSSGPADMSDPRNHEAPLDANGMSKWLALGYESTGSGETFDAVSERLLDRSFSPKQRAALLRALEDVAGIEYKGQVEDRAGRIGAAFSVKSQYGGLPKIQSLLFDNSSGKLLAYEEQLTGDVGKLNVKSPAVVLYITYL